MSDSNYPADDRELDDYLAGTSALSRTYAGFPPETTPPALDDVIIDAARKQGRGKPRPAPSKPAKPARAPRRRRWLQPLAAIAVLVLGCALLVDLLTDQTVVDPDDSSPSGNQEIAVPQRPTQGAGTEITPSGPDTAESAQSPNEEDKPEALAPDADRRQTRSAQQEESSQKRADQKKSKQKQVNNNAAPTQPEPAPSAEPGPQPKPANKPAVTPKPAPAPEPQPQPAAPGAAQQSIPQQPSPRSGPAPDSTGLPGPNADLPPSPLDERAYRDSPDEWMSRIVFLFDTNQRAPAVAELKEFRVRYPDYPIPAELQNLDAR